MRRLMSSIFVGMTLVLAATAAGQTLRVLAVPPSLPDRNADAVVRAAARILLAAEQGDQLRVVDAATLAPVATIVKPRARSDRALLRRVAGELSKITSHYRGSDAGPARIHIPRLMDAIGSLQTPATTETRVLLVGSMFFGDGSDARWDFSHGRYPSDGHILATRELSTYGTAGLSPLPSTRVDVVNLEPIPDDLDRYYVQRFWSVYLAERGVPITSWQAELDLGVEMHGRDLRTPFERFEIDRRDLRREIRRVDGGQLRPKTWTLAVAIDASASMQSAFDEVRSQVPRVAEQLYLAGAEVRLCVVPFRQSPLEPLPLTRVRARASDGGVSVEAVQGYLDSVQTVSSGVHPDAAITAAIALLEAEEPSERTVLLVIGDTPSETDRRAETRTQLFDGLRRWLAEDDGRSVRGVYLGQPGDGRSEFFHELSELSGGAPSASFAAVADEVINEAADVTRGIRRE